MDRGSSPSTTTTDSAHMFVVTAEYGPAQYPSFLRTGTCSVLDGGGGGKQSRGRGERPQSLGQVLFMAAYVTA